MQNKTQVTKQEKRKALTVKNLQAADACSQGMEWITPILKEKGGATKARKRLITEKREWWRWAFERGFDVTTGCEVELAEAGLCQVASNSGVGGSSSNSGDYGSSSNSGDYGSSSNSGVGGSSSNSGVYGSSSNSGVGGSSSNSGFRGSSSNSGVGGSSSNSGDYGSSSNSGVGGFAAGFAIGARVMGEIDGTALIAAYWLNTYTQARVAVGYVGEDEIEKGVWYEADSSTGKLKRSVNQESPK